MATNARRRLMRDLKKIQDDPTQGLTASPTEDNIMKWDAIIFGPEDTPWEDGIFQLTLEFSEEYPNKAP